VRLVYIRTFVACDIMIAKLTAHMMDLGSLRVIPIRAALHITYEIASRATSLDYR
jgi:hypothetical protein